MIIGILIVIILIFLLTDYLPVKWFLVISLLLIYFAATSAVSFSGGDITPMNKQQLELLTKARRDMIDMIRKEELARLAESQKGVIIAEEQLKTKMKQTLEEYSNLSNNVLQSVEARIKAIIDTERQINDAVRIYG